MASVFTNTVEGCLDALYEEIRLRHSDMIDDKEEMTEDKFNEIFEERLHEEIDNTVNVMYESNIDAIIEEIGFIKLCKAFTKLNGDPPLSSLFNDDDINLMGKLIYPSLYEAVLEKRDFEIYMDMWKAEKEIEKNDSYAGEADDFNLRGETEEDSESEEESKCDECDKWLNEGKERCKKCGYHPSDFYNDPFAFLGWEAIHSS
jgi:hypothetical protein